jgi:hypothetical protein
MVILGLLAIVILPEVPLRLKAATCVIAVISGFALFAFGLVQKREDFAREDKEGFRDRLLKRMHDKMFLADTVKDSVEQEKQISSEVSESDPRVYVDIIDQREAFHAKTIFSLRNRGDGVAHRVQIQPLKLSCGEALFPAVEIIAGDEEKQIVPEVEKVFPVWRHDISRIMLKEWDHAGDINVHEFVRPMSITYEDFNAERKWETTFDLVYQVVQDIVQRDWKLEEKPELLQVKNIRFRAIS